MSEAEEGEKRQEKASQTRQGQISYEKKGQKSNSGERIFRFLSYIFKGEFFCIGNCFSKKTSQAYEKL